MRSTHQLNAEVIDLLKRKARPMTIDEMLSLLRSPGVLRLGDCLERLEKLGRVKPGPAEPRRTWQLS